MEIVTKAGSRGTGLLGKCTGCSLPLPLRLPETHEQASEWVCARCGTSYRAVLLESWPLDLRCNVRPAASQLHQDGPPTPAEASTDFAAGPDVDQPDPISIAFPGHQGIQCELETRLSRQLDVEIDRRVNLEVQLRGPPFADEIREHGDQAYDDGAVNRFRELVRHSSEQLNDLFAALGKGNSAELHVAESISQDGLFRTAEDKDLFVGLGITPPSGGYPSRHALRVGMLATSIGVTLGWDERTLLDLGIGCLLHDVGMLGVNRATYQSKRILAPSDFEEIARHPVLTFESLQHHLDQVPLSARMVAYQMHERCNGTGYPRGYTGDQIHDLAKIAAVADLFVALVSPRPYRPGMVPHHALKKILCDTEGGLYDRKVVRALLNTISLFPIGSCVALNDGQVGRVIRATGEQYDRPIVEVWRRGHLSASPAVIDLSTQQELRITNTLVRLDE